METSIATPSGPATPDVPCGDAATKSLGSVEAADEVDAEGVGVPTLLAASSSTTPGGVSLELNFNLDHIAVQTYLTDVDENPISGCQQTDVYRIGKDAADWAIGETITIPLSFDEVLVPGLYVLEIRAYVDVGWWLLPTRLLRRSRYFEVTGSGLHFLTPQEYDDLAYPVMYDSAGNPYTSGGGLPWDYEPPPPPCDDPPPYSDVVAVDDAVSSVDFDSWANVSTRQPLRWVAPSPYIEDCTHSLEFHARSDTGEGLWVQVWGLDEEPPEDVEVTGVSVQVEQPDGTTWRSTTGRVRLQRDENDQLSVFLSNIALDKARSLDTDPELTRLVSAGTITGKLIHDVAP